MRARLTSKVALLTTTNRQDDVLVAWAKNFGVSCFRGDEHNVLARFQDALNVCPTEHIVRVCCDNPLVCGSEIDRLVEFHLARQLDYSFNHIPRLGNNYIDGFGAEIFRSEILSAIQTDVVTPEEREHVTRYFWNRKTELRFGVVPAPPELAYPQYSFDIDTEIDFQRFLRFTSSGMLKMTAIEATEALKRKGTLEMFSPQYKKNL